MSKSRQGQTQYSNNHRFKVNWAHRYYANIDTQDHQRKAQTDLNIFQHDNQLGACDGVMDGIDLVPQSNIVSNVDFWIDPKRSIIIAS